MDADGDGVIAACADNTTCNTSMVKGLFGVLSGMYNWFFIGCCVHCMDLLAEDVAKLPDVAEIIADCKYIVLFAIRYSMIFETFLELQKARRRTDPKASMLGLKTFPDTRFAYAFFMVFSVCVNWSVLVTLVDTPEFKLMKRSARDTEKTKRRSAFTKFENLIWSGHTKRKAEAAVSLMQPISTSLHYLEGDDVDCSHVMAVYVVADQNAKTPTPEIVDAFSSETADAVKACFAVRWNGQGRKIGIKHDAHCLAFKVDLVLQFAIKFALGGDILRAINSSFRRSNWDSAVSTYCKGNTALYTTLVSQMDKFSAKTGGYATIWRQAEALAKQIVAELMEDESVPREGATSKALDAETKADKVKLLIAVLKAVDASGSRALSVRPKWGAVVYGESEDKAERLFALMCCEVLSIVTQACAVE